MENFILKLVATICVSIISFAIVVSRKDDIDLSAICISTIFEILALFIIFLGENLLNFILMNII